ncbi:hypothetical protein conserved [Leishmania donovani]|uniref:Uncharacterized protein n=3 Tax=Leishmania donovani species complex TaxID=38574 RepID=A4I8I0_LEIIN|nr:conserved hypothetical protein [Leishmania infantum JPCM5]XP_003863787.1 hypothetical protein, conserved [Leishmania donovani]CAC9528237.1 hypothetical_protein_-_conserved [Leishmania infantum]AYU81927.1 hypothetical protein LdCL_320043600 [Leishmania donovani]TPP43874.1 hypothetical protein CGC21_21365 [Leishmania donovani]TPP47373.1 hypothetical protein CGC20_35140 [Leishmania donovani]CAJ1991913.1 hypothetical protein conserved [Leishmania donovani]|eukprot:XP_001468049.1 conserved hypothetical protein [Leishmania infantum JPCM5]
MSVPSLHRSDRSGDPTRDRAHYVRAQRQHLVRETRMLQMALEELQEEAERANSEEALVRRAIDTTHRELLRCLLHLALTEQDSTRGTVAASGAQAQYDATSAIICEVLRRYKRDQDAFTQEAKQRLESIREEARQACVNVGDTLAVPQGEHAHSSGVGTIVEATELDSPRSALEALREMKAEVDEETEATLLSIGRTLFC